MICFIAIEIMSIMVQTAGLLTNEPIKARTVFGLSQITGNGRPHVGI